MSIQPGGRQENADQDKAGKNGKRRYAGVDARQLAVRQVTPAFNHLLF